MTVRKGQHGNTNTRPQRIFLSSKRRTSLCASIARNHKWCQKVIFVLVKRESHLTKKLWNIQIMPRRTGFLRPDQAISFICRSQVKQISPGTSLNIGAVTSTWVSPTLYLPGLEQQFDGGGLLASSSSPTWMDKAPLWRSFPPETVQTQIGTRWAAWRSHLMPQSNVVGYPLTLACFRRVSSSACGGASFSRN